MLRLFLRSSKTRIVIMATTSKAARCAHEPECWDAPTCRSAGLVVVNPEDKCVSSLRNGRGHLPLPACAIEGRPSELMILCNAGGMSCGAAAELKLWRLIC